jgi:hypothetical protein
VERGTTAEIALTVRSITQGGYAGLVLDRLTRLACRAVGAEQAAIFVRDRHDPRATIAVGAHGLDQDIIGRHFGADEGVVGEVLRGGGVTAFTDPAQLPRPMDDGIDWEMVAGGCAPIEWDGVVQAALVAVAARSGRRFARQEFGVMTAVADVAGAALEHAERREHTEETVRARVETLAAALDLRDRDTGRHVAEVVELALEVGEKLDLSRPAMAELEFAARLHDVGKIAVPDPILRKPAPLSLREWDMMRRHPEWGSGMLAHIPGLEAVAIVVRFHHERYDGRGYPDGLEGECIPLASRIVAVCDAYNAIVADRPYRSGRTHEEALEEIRRHAGTQFDPEVVEAFCESAGRSRATSWSFRRATAG